MTDEREDGDAIVDDEGYEVTRRAPVTLAPIAVALESSELPSRSVRRRREAIRRRRERLGCRFVEG